MYANNYISSIVSRQLPEFVRTDHPRFVTLLEKYYEYMEQSGKTMDAMKNMADYMDIDYTREDLLKYFKNQIIPSFPEEAALSKQKIMKAARDFYAKKGTPDGFKFLFRILYGQEIEVYFPKEDILRASDGKWQLPQALRISITDTSDAVLGGNVNVFFNTANTAVASKIVANGLNFITSGIEANSYIRIDGIKRKITNVTSSQLTVDIPFPAPNTGAGQIFDSEVLYKVTLSPYDDFDFNLLERRKGIGSVSRTSCIIENAVRTLDKDTGRDIVEIYVSNVKKPFETNEDLIVEYIDPTTNTTATFSSQIISLISNVYLTRNRLGVAQSGSRYKTGDPVVFFGGLNGNSDEAIKAVATVQNVSSGFLDFVTLNAPGYFFRDWQNSIVQIENNTGIGANLIIDAIWDDGGANSASFSFNTDSIYYKLNKTIDDPDYEFDAVALANADTTLATAFTYEAYTLGKIRLLTLVNRGSFYETEPTFDPISVHNTDYTDLELAGDNGFFIIPGTEVSNYNPTSYTIQLSGSNSAFSIANGFYTGARLFIEASASSAHHVHIVDYIVENNGGVYTKTLYLESPFETNITTTNAGNFRYYMDFREDVRNTGKLGFVAVANAGIGYSGTDKVQFIGTGYGASASITVDGSGGITGVTLTGGSNSRGEGYVDRPTCKIVNSSGGASSGSGAVLVAYTLSDGETITAATSGIGEIQTFNLINRGFDYSSAPIVSLKVADFLTDNLPSAAIVVAGDSIWQGGATNAGATFQATVDEVYRETPSRSVIRVFNYNGTVDLNQPFKVNTATQNITCNLYTVNTSISFNNINPATPRLYPFFYGNGLAKANAEFASGLIKYDGYYLNTDGHVSADKKLQNKDYYHNFSYEIQSSKSLNEYKKTIYDVAHPAGMQLLSKYVILDKLSDKSNATGSVQSTTEITPASYYWSSGWTGYTLNGRTPGSEGVFTTIIAQPESSFTFFEAFRVGEVVKLGSGGTPTKILSIDSATQMTVETGITQGSFTEIYKRLGIFEIPNYSKKWIDNSVIMGYDIADLGLSVGDTIQVNNDTAPFFRRYVRKVTDVDTGSQRITLDAPLYALGDGKITIIDGSDQAVITGNTYPLTETFSTGDQRYDKFAVTNPISLTATVLSITGGPNNPTIELDDTCYNPWKPITEYYVNGVRGVGYLDMSDPKQTYTLIDVIGDTTAVPITVGDTITFSYMQTIRYRVSFMDGNTLTLDTNGQYNASNVAYVHADDSYGVDIIAYT